MTDDVERYADALVRNPLSGFSALIGLVGVIAQNKKREEATMMEQVLTVLEYVEMADVKRWRAKPQELDLVRRANGNVDNVASVSSLTRQLERAHTAHVAIAQLLEQHEMRASTLRADNARLREQVLQASRASDEARAAVVAAHNKADHATRTANDTKEEIERHIRHARDANNEVERLRNVVKALTRRLGKLIGEAAAGGFDHG